MQGHHGIKEDVFLSLPCSLGAHGVCDILQMPLSESEEAALVKSAQTLYEIQSGVKI